MSIIGNISQDPAIGINGFYILPSDINTYKGMCSAAKAIARQRATRVVQNMVVNRTETSILPPYIISELYLAHTDPTERKLYNFITRIAYDGGTYFRLEEKVRN